MYVNNVTFRNWIVDNGDDSISLKANSTNVLIENCDFYTGLGFAVGSIGQYGTVPFTLNSVLHISPTEPPPPLLPPFLSGST